jgi:NADPH:quinone reductase
MVDRSQITLLPADLDFTIASTFVLTYSTSHHALKDRAQIQWGETLLGAAGGVGLATVEIDRQLDAHVIAAASNDEKLAMRRQHGAREVIDYHSEDLRERIKQITALQGVDVIFDPVGGSYSEPTSHSMEWRGRFLVIGFTPGEIPPIPLNLRLLKMLFHSRHLYRTWAAAQPGKPEGPA